MNDERQILNEIERGERWLAAYPTPSAPEGLTENVRAAVRRELACQSRPRSAFPWAAVMGLAAAAAIVLAVWLGDATLIPTPADSGPIQYVEAVPPAEAQEAAEDVVAIVKINEGLDDLESWSEESVWDLDGSSLSDAMDMVYRENSTLQPG